jgi:hypothetical protein
MAFRTSGAFVWIVSASCCRSLSRLRVAHRSPGVDEAARRAAGGSTPTLHQLPWQHRQGRTERPGSDPIDAVLRDRLGASIGPAMRATAPSHAAPLTQAQIVDLAHFLRQRIEAVTRNRTLLSTLTSFSPSFLLLHNAFFPHLLSTPPSQSNLPG